MARLIPGNTPLQKNAAWATKGPDHGFCAVGKRNPYRITYRRKWVPNHWPSLHPNGKEVRLAPRRAPFDLADSTSVTIVYGSFAAPAGAKCPNYETAYCRSLVALLR